MVLSAQLPHAHWPNDAKADVSFVINYEEADVDSVLKVLNPCLSVDWIARYGDNDFTFHSTTGCFSLHADRGSDWHAKVESCRRVVVSPP